MMKWTHLPIGGGLYDQHPKMLDDFLVIAQIEGKVERARQKKKEQQQARKQGSAGSGRRAGRRR